MIKYFYENFLIKKKSVVNSKPHFFFLQVKKKQLKHAQASVFVLVSISKIMAFSCMFLFVTVNLHFQLFSLVLEYLSKGPTGDESSPCSVLDIAWLCTFCIKMLCSLQISCAVYVNMLLGFWSQRGSADGLQGMVAGYAELYIFIKVFRKTLGGC